MSTQPNNPLDSFQFVRIGKVRSLIDRLSDAASPSTVQRTLSATKSSLTALVDSSSLDPQDPPNHTPVTVNLPSLLSAPALPGTTTLSPSLGLSGALISSPLASSSVVTSQPKKSKQIPSSSLKQKALLDRLSESRPSPPVSKSALPDMINASVPTSLPASTASLSHAQITHSPRSSAVFTGTAPASPIRISSAITSPSTRTSAAADDYYTKLTSLANEKALWDEVAIIRTRFEEEHTELQQRHEETVRAAERQKEQMDKVLHLANSMFDKFAKLREFQEPRWKEERLQAEMALQAAQRAVVAVTPPKSESRMTSPMAPSLA